VARQAYFLGKVEEDFVAFSSLCYTLRWLAVKQAFFKSELRHAKFFCNSGVQFEGSFFTNVDISDFPLTENDIVQNLAILCIEDFPAVGKQSNDNVISKLVQQIDSTKKALLGQKTIKTIVSIHKVPFLDEIVVQLIELSQVIPESSYLLVE
jgi:hypothetical protein